MTVEAETVRPHTAGWHLSSAASRSWRAKTSWDAERTRASVLESPTVSRHHARISIRAGVALIEDLESKNGTYLSETRVTTATPLQDGDQIRIGAFLLTFRRPDPNADTTTQTLA